MILARIAVIAALLLGAAQGRGDSISIEASLSPPGGLAPSNTPQLILLTFDDAVNAGSYPVIQQIVTNRVNPNGTPIQATFFVSGDWTDYWLVHQLYAQGHEIAVHTLTHTTGNGTDRTTWRAEIAGCRRALTKLAAVPKNRIRGFRAPYLAHNNDSFQVLKEQGFDYDSSITESPGVLSESAARMIWPYTLDNGVRQTCWTGPAPDPVPGLFEVPLWSLLDPSSGGWIPMDPSGDQTRVLATLQTNFLARYHGNRAPLGIFLHAGNWAGRTAAWNSFMDWTRTFSNVWFVSLSAAIDYMKAPQPAETVAAFPPFVTQVLDPIPESQARSFSFEKGTVRTCGEPVTAYPAPDSIYTTFEPVPGTSLLEWDESAYGYAVCSAESPTGAWTTADTIHGMTCWTGALPVSGSAFYKLIAIP